MDKKYNGWTNYETWNVNLWLTSNDEESYKYFVERAKELYDESETDKHFSKKENATLKLAAFIYETVEENNPLLDTASLYADILRANLSTSQVNYYEIAEGLINAETEE